MRHRGQQLPYDPKRKVRTPEHVVADLSYNFLERKVLERGHWLDAPRNDYGIDATMFHHNERGEVENGEVRFQTQGNERTEDITRWVMDFPTSGVARLAILVLRAFSGGHRCV